MKTKQTKNKPIKGLDYTGRCIMHPPLTAPGWMLPCPICKSWVNCEEGKGLHILEIEK